MKANIGGSKQFKSLTKREQERLTNICAEEVRLLAQQRVAEYVNNVDEAWMMTTLAILHNDFGFGSRRLNKFIALWDSYNRGIRHSPCESAKDLIAAFRGQIDKSYTRKGAEPFPVERYNRIKKENGVKAE